MSREPQRRGFGVAAGLPAEVCGPLAETCEAAGYDSLWSNDHPGAKGLETLAEFAKATDRLDLIRMYAPELQVDDVESAPPPAAEPAAQGKGLRLELLQALSDLDE